MPETRVIPAKPGGGGWRLFSKIFSMDYEKRLFYLPPPPVGFPGFSKDC